MTEKTNTTHTNNVAILGDCIIRFNRGIKSEFNKAFRCVRARFKHLPGGLLKDFLHHIDPTLDKQNFEAAIIYIGITNILYDSTSQYIDLLLLNIK